MNIVFKVSDNIKEKMIDYYQDLKKEKTPPYALFQAIEADTIITLYESGKVMFQGMSADIDANMWIDQERHLNNRIIDVNSKKDKEKKEKNNVFYHISSIGSDEVGTGDYFGPIVVSSSFVNKEDIAFLDSLGVKDSKKINDDKIKKIAPSIIKKIPYSTFILNNKTYNNNYSKDINMNKIKAILHNKVLSTLIKKDNYCYDKIIIDQFVNEKKYYEYIKGAKETVKNIVFETKAEDKYYSVACASIISRYIFLQEMDKLSKKLNIEIPKGAGIIVDEIGKKIVKEKGKEILTEIAKLNFKNTDKILNS